jgi:TonB family protein
MKIFVIANVLCVWMAGAPQVGSFDNQAISSAQEMSASELDGELPDRPFAGWFSELVGPKTGVVWQLTECGKQIVATSETGQDLPACAEITARLPDGRRVFVAISVGTFKKGLTGKPSFFRSVIEQNELLYQVRRLSDLPEMLSSTDRPSASGAEHRVADLPAIKTDPAWTIAPFRYLAPPSSAPPVTGDQSQAEEPPAAPPPPSTSDLVQVPESMSQSRAITKVKPDYPSNAKNMNAIGKVEVEITISEIGLVVEATAISGCLALRSAAEEAARKWVFEPTTLNGAPVRVSSVLTFVFAPGEK